MLNSIKSSMNAVGSTASGYLAIMQSHSTSWQRAQIINNAISEREHIAQVAKRMQKLANELAKLDDTTVAATQELVAKALEANGFK